MKRSIELKRVEWIIKPALSNIIQPIRSARMNEQPSVDLHRNLDSIARIYLRDKHIFLPTDITRDCHQPIVQTKRQDRLTLSRLSMRYNANSNETLRTFPPSNESRFSSERQAQSPSTHRQDSTWTISDSAPPPPSPTDVPSNPRKV